jgi:hypothetical protein
MNLCSDLNYSCFLSLLFSDLRSLGTLIPKQSQSTSANKPPRKNIYTSTVKLIASQIPELLRGTTGLQMKAFVEQTKFNDRNNKYDQLAKKKSELIGHLRCSEDFLRLIQLQRRSFLDRDRVSHHHQRPAVTRPARRRFRRDGEERSVGPNTS